MSESPPNPWIHLGECPVCVDGIVRVRVCTDECVGKHIYALCDECEAMWLEPDTAGVKQFPDAENPVCPICGASLYGEQAHWALPQDIVGTKWAAEAVFDVPRREELPGCEGDSESSSGENETGGLDSDRIAATLDKPDDEDDERRAAGC